VRTFNFNPGIDIDGLSLAPVGVRVLGKLVDARPPNVKAYEAEIEKRLQEIGTKEVGRFVFTALGKTGKKLVIKPYTAEDAKEYGACNATTGADDLNDASPKDVHYYRGRLDNPATARDERYDRPTLGMSIFKRPVLGTGKGSGAEIHYTDGMYKAGGCCSLPGPGNVGNNADEVLLHEIVHALRTMQGKRNPVPTEGTARKYDTEEEFIAILVTNIYMSEKHATAFRADHQGYNALKPPLDTPAGFLGDPQHLRMLKKMAGEAPGLFADLQNVSTAVFNPVREYLLNKGKYGG
jgi:hypothetical protein